MGPEQEGFAQLFYVDVPTGAAQVGRTAANKALPRDMGQTLLNLAEIEGAQVRPVGLAADFFTQGQRALPIWRRPIQSVNRASGIVNATNSNATTTSGV